MRKLLLSAFALALTTGLALAGEVKFVSYDKEKKELKAKDGDKEVTYKITDKTTYKNGDKEMKEGKGVEKLAALKADDKLDVTTEKDKDEVTAVKFAGKKK